MNLFGGIMQAAIMQAALTEWQKLPPDELSCIEQTLQQRGLSVRSLMQQGVAPFDIRLADVRASCKPQIETNLTASPPSETVVAPERFAGKKSVFAVEGLALGDKVAFNSGIYREYTCTPSEQFVGFLWCQRHAIDNGPQGAIHSSYTILHAEDGSAFYVNREIQNAFFGPGEADAEIERLSSRFGTPPRLVRMPQGVDQQFSQGVIASWGSVTLEPVDEAARDQLGIGRSPHRGILVDYLNNFQMSVRKDLPVFRIGGGAGFVWAATFDSTGHGHLRFFAIDAAALASGVASNNNNAPPPTSNDPWKDCQSSDADARLKGCTVVIDAKGYGSKAKLADALDGRCRAYNEQQNYTQAVTDCKAAIDANPRYSWAYTNLGTAYQHLGASSQAIAALNKGLELKINSIWPWLDRAEILEASGDVHAALSDYQYALLLDHSNKKAGDGVARLGQALRPATACLGEVAKPSFGTQTSGQPESNTISAAGDSPKELANGIAALKNYAADLNGERDQNKAFANKSRQEADRRRAELMSRFQDSRTIIDNAQNLLSASIQAKSQADQISQQIVDRQNELNAKTSSPNRSSPQHRKIVQELKSELKKLFDSKAQAQRDAENKASSVTAARQAAEQEASEYAAIFLDAHALDADAERADQCAAQAGQRADQLTAKIAEIQVKITDDRLKSEREASETLLADLAEFAKGNPDLIPLEIAPLVTALKQAVGSGDPEAISTAREKIASRLNDIAQFKHFRDNENSKREAIAKAKLQNAVAAVHVVLDFTQAYMRSNITDNRVSGLLKLNDGLNSILISPEVDALTKATASAEGQLKELGLAKQYAEFKTKNFAPLIPEEWKNDKNRFLVEGPDDEILFLINETGRAHVKRDLHGHLVFDGGEASTCFADTPNFDDFTSLQITLEIKSKGASEISLSTKPCALPSLMEYDIVVARRDALLRGPSERVKALLEAVNNDQFSLSSVLSAQEVRKRQDDESVFSLNLEDEIIARIGLRLRDGNR